MVIQYVDQMNKSGIFKESELLEWDNTATLQSWSETTKHFTEIWVDQMAFRRRQEDDRPFNSALALIPHSNARGTVGGLTVRDAEIDSLVEALEHAHEETATLQDDLDSTTVVTTPPAEIIAAATTTNNDSALIAQLTVQGTAQTSQINRLLTALFAGRGGGGGGGGRRNDNGQDRDRDCDHDQDRNRDNRQTRGQLSGRRNRGRQQEGDGRPALNYCKNCERTVGHKPADCYQLKENVASRPS